VRQPGTAGSRLGRVNPDLDLAVTGLTIGAGTKPAYDLITSLVAKASSASGSA
jgi:hypothetical protein